MVDSKRKAIESLYTGTCTVTEYQENKDPITKITKHLPVDVLINQPCKLSFKNIFSVNESDTAATVKQSSKLFIAPEIKIKSGSKITVKQNDITTEYAKSGKPAVYSTHQEIMLELFKGWS
jgi:hypothetical protein